MCARCKLEKAVAIEVGEFVLILPMALFCVITATLAGNEATMLGPLAAIGLNIGAGFLGLYRRPAPNKPITQEVIR